jgi:hypothetical protein
MRLVTLLLGCSLVLGGHANAQTPDPAAPTTAPADRTPITARVIEVQGDVQYSPLEPENWQPVKVGDELPELTQIRTGLRSSVKLQIGEEEPYTAMIIEAVGKTILSEAYRTQDAKRVRVGVGYGRIRAGVAEGGLRSEFTVDSPIATLSKRGTWDFGMFYERGTDRFEVFLLDYGLVEALNKATRELRELRPGEAVTQVMRRWLDEAQRRSNVPVQDLLGQGDLDIAFNRLQNDGLRVTNPDGGAAALLDLGRGEARNAFLEIARDAVGVTLPPPLSLPPPGGSRLRPEGFFGTGRGDQLVRVIIDQGSSLVAQGAARPGAYTFRRSALEGWIQANRK